MQDRRGWLAIEIRFSYPSGHFLGLTTFNDRSLVVAAIVSFLYMSPRFRRFSVKKIRPVFLGVLLAGLLFPLHAIAQDGTVSGTLLSALDGQPVSNAAIQLRAPGGVNETGLSNAQGRFRVVVPAGTYWLVFEQFGYETTRIDGIVVVSGQTVEIQIRPTPVALILNPIVVSPSRQEQQALQAPTATSVVREEDIEGRVGLSIADHVSTIPGIDAAPTGMMRTALVARGFNDPFSTALLVRTDNRYANLPSNRLNALYMLPTTDLDIERVEVSLGPASALYGPNATNGVMHLITKSPIDYPGSTISIAGGERSTFQGMFRSAWSAPSERFGLKLSGQYFRGDDWTYTDPVEVAAAAANPANPFIGAARFVAERWSGEVRFDYRPDEDTEFVTILGSNTTLNQVEVSGAGRSMVDGWINSFAQFRFRKGRLFAQAFGNFSDAGDSFFLRTGLPAIDNSRMWVGQVQHGVDVFGNTALTYGLDLQRSDTRTDGSITGRYESDDIVDEGGAYLQTVTDVSSIVQAIGALRVDYHNRLDDPVWSPRVGLLITPVEGHTFRATFNRAFRTPSVLDLFLDVLAGSIPIAPGFEFDIRVVGASENGYTFDECAGGVGGFCMRVPGLEGQLPADATLLWDQFVGAIAPALADLLPNPGASVGTVLRRFSPAGAAVGDPFPLDLVGPRDIEPLRPRIDNTFELGYKGLLRDRLLVSGNIYYQQIRDFVGPNVVETPSVFLDPASTSVYVNAQLQPLVDTGAIAQADVDALVAGLVQIPMGTVGPAQWDAADILLTYRNIGDVNLWGFEAGAEFIANPRFSFAGSIGHVSEDCFDLDNDGSCFSPEDRALNAPKWKGSISARYDNEAAGFFTEARARFISGFPQAAGVFVGDIESYSVVDASVGVKFSRFPQASLLLSASNVFDNGYRPLIGAPELGRLTMLRLRYDF